MENDYKVLYVKTSVSSKVKTFAMICLVLAVILLIAGVAMMDDIPIVYTICGSIYLVINWVIVLGLSKIVEAAEYHKAHIVQSYNQINEDEEDIYKL